MTVISRPGLLVQAALVGCLTTGCGDDTASSAHSGAANASDGAATAGASSSSEPSGDSAGREPGSDAGATRAVKIYFRAMVGERSFACSEQYEQVGSSKVAAVPADFRFYLQDVKLIAADGTKVPLKLEARSPWQTPDVALIDFEDMSNDCHGTPGMNDYVSGTVPAGQYSGVVFTNGVPEALNHLDQATQPPPLDLTDMYWQWLTGYRFFVLELKEANADARAEAAAAEDAGVVLPGIGLLHIGSTACRRNMGCTKGNRNEIRLANFDPDTDVIAADAAAAFVETDITQEMQCHSAGKLCAPMFQRIGVNWETGQSEPDLQQIYRVLPGELRAGSP